MRRLIALTAFVFAFACSHAQVQRIIIISLDGAADWVVDKMISDGKMPNLKRMKEEGVYAESVIVSSPSVTAAGHATIWTGAWPAIHGVTGNSVPLAPRAEHGISEIASGFSSSALKAQPIWMSAALSGKTAAVLSATQSFPVEKYAAEVKDTGRLSIYNGFETPLFPAKVYSDTGALKDAERFGRTGKEFLFNIGDSKFAAFFAKDEQGSYRDATIYRLGGDRASFAAYMKADSSEFSQPMKITKENDWGMATFALLDLAPDLSHFMLYQGAINAIKGLFDPVRGEEFIYSSGGFYDLPIDEYGEGLLGPTYWMNGNGAAEKRLLKLIERDYTRVVEGAKWAAKSLQPTLVIHYSPATDSMGHLLMGVMDPSSGAYDKALAEQLWAAYAETFRFADDAIGRIIENAGPSTIVAVVSDHGMEGVDKLISVNRILVDAGLAAADADKLDYAKSKIVSAPWNSFALSVNSTDWKNGIVPAQERQSVLDAAAKALLAYTDQATGIKPITRVMKADEVVGGGGTAGGDLYIDLAPGYYPTVRFTKEPMTIIEGKLGAGVHGYLGTRDKMRAIFYAIGPGIARGRNLGDIRQIDIAPSLGILAGIPTPMDAQGTNLRLAQSKN